MIKIRGYNFIFNPEHPHATSTGYIQEHVLIAEAALGHFLPENVVVHHVNGTKDSGPLVVCQDQAYHLLIERRTRALKECGHVNWRKCRYCKKYTDISKMKECNGGQSYYHKSCNAQQSHEARMKKKCLA
jgi:hypothetical protein